jgi:putative ABC transport system permease protein
MGGVTGLLIVVGLTFAASYFADVELYLTLENVFWGIGISVVIGLLSGIIPAYLASQLSPVEAIRSK